MNGTTRYTLAMVLGLTMQSAAAEAEVVEEQVQLSFPVNAPVEAVYERIGIEARKACRSRAVYPHQQLSAEAACRQRFIDDAVVALDRAALTALHRQSRGGEVTRLADAE